MRNSKSKLVLALAAISLAGGNSTNAAIIYSSSPTGTTTYSLPSGTGYSVATTGGLIGTGYIFFLGVSSTVTATFTTPETSVGFTGVGVETTTPITSVSFSNGDTFSTVETLPASGSYSFDYTDTTPFTSATFNLGSGGSQELTDLLAASSASSPVPEPASLTALGVVAAGALGLRHRRRSVA